MLKKLNRTDFFFVASLSLISLMYIFFLFVVPTLIDESFYAVVPFRLVNGDSLVQHEWNLTQFSSLFLYLPVYIWTAIKGSADGIFFFLRCIYLLIHAAISGVIYAFFRKYGNWAVVAAMMFYIQMPYRIIAISYQSMFVIFLLLLTFCLISIYQKNDVRFYVLAGVCYGCCCVCNPIFCFAFVLYLGGCALWTKQHPSLNSEVVVKSSKKDKKIIKKQKEQPLEETVPVEASYNCFFTKEAISRFFCGTLIVAVAAVAFFLLTGGTIDSIFRNIENLFFSSEYDVVSDSIFSKLIETIDIFNTASLGVPWILPVLFVVLFFDKKKQRNTHRFAYLFVVLLWSVIFIIGVKKVYLLRYCGISIPFFVTSTICYVLTENKNKLLFYLMYIPLSIATVFHYIAADTHLAAIGIVLVVGDVVGVLFAMDLWKEMRSASKENSKTDVNKIFSGLSCGTIIISLCVQMLFFGGYFIDGRVPMEDAVKVTNGPYSGLYMTQEQHDDYNKRLNDLDVIKFLSAKGDPVAIASVESWMYMYLERPMAVHTAWYWGFLDRTFLEKYYKENPEKIPKYIYIESVNSEEPRVEMVSDMFEFTREDLSIGALLTVTKCKF